MRESFNSQRDGILRKILVAHKKKRIVSIPNGMEFYTGCCFGTGDPFVVSIPNGMEFYKRQNRAKSPKNCFNSQRDGILP